MTTLLVTGASGQLGRRVLDHLLTQSGVHIVATTRSPATLQDYADRGVEVRAANFDDADSLAHAFAGADRALLISTDALDQPGKRLRQHQAAVKAFAAAGVRHVVYTSMPKPEPGSPIPFAPDHYGTEQALADSGLSWTILRNAWYMENLLQSLPQSLAAGQWFSAAADGRVAHVSRDDAARAAAHALMTPPPGNTILDVTGPVALSTEEIAAQVSDVTGKALAVVPVTPEQLEAGMLAHGIPAFLAPILASFDVNTAAGRADAVSDTVQRLTGRAPLGLREFLQTHHRALTTG